jgi:hypothetical protein
MARANAEVKETPAKAVPALSEDVRLECRRFPPGTAARIDAAKGKFESRANFFREAVERELARREEQRGA